MPETYGVANFLDDDCEVVKCASRIAVSDDVIPRNSAGLSGTTE